jgi:hypothetical protein
MISLHKKFVFVHVNKTGGTSIVEALCKFEDRTEEDVLHDHSAFAAYKRVLGLDLWNEFYTFGFIRNPYERMVSAYEYRRQILEVQTETLDAKNKDFADWVLQFVYPKVKRQNFSEWTNQMRLLGDGGKPMVEDLFLFEEIESAWETIQSKLGISEELPHTNKTVKKPLGEYYQGNDEVRDLVREFHSNDFAWAESQGINWDCK